MKSCFCLLSAGPCQNSGICNTVVEEFEGDLIARIVCQCQPQWTGVFCTEPVAPPSSACQSNPCINLGTCREVVNGFTCDCLPGERQGFLLHYNQLNEPMITGLVVLWMQSQIWLTQLILQLRLISHCISLNEYLNVGSEYK